MNEMNVIKNDELAEVSANIPELNAGFKLMEEPELQVFTMEEAEMEYAFESNCLSAGTMITMADGSLKAIEEIQESDWLKTFNHEAGKWTKNQVYLAYKDPEPGASFTLHFENGRAISIVGTHDLFEQESMKYVRVSDARAEELTGRHFYCADEDKFVKLTGISRSEAPVDYYSIYTKFDANCIADGMLTVPDDSDEVLNIYEFNPDLSANTKVLAEDIEKYGLYEYSPDDGVSKEEFDYLGLKYANLMVGKGFGTWDEFYSRLEIFKGFIK